MTKKGEEKKREGKKMEKKRKKEGNFDSPNAAKKKEGRQVSSGDWIQSVSQ